MQNLLSGPPLRLCIILGLAAMVTGLGAAWLSARLADGGRPSGRQMGWAIVASLATAASAVVARPEDLAWSLGLAPTLIVLASVDLAAFRLPTY